MVGPALPVISRSPVYAGIRTLRLADGADEVHRGTAARLELARRAVQADA